MVIVVYVVHITVTVARCPCLSPNHHHQLAVKVLLAWGPDQP